MGRPMQYRHSPGFIGWEWIETPRLSANCCLSAILPALLVGSGLKPLPNLRCEARTLFSRLYWLGVD